MIPSFGYSFNEGRQWQWIQRFPSITPIRFLGRASNINLAYFCQFADQASIRLILKVVEKSQNVGIKTGFGWVRIGNDRIDLDFHHALQGVNPPVYFDALALDRHWITCHRNGL